MIDGTRVWSVCPFWNELDVFEVRLREQDSVVDVWVASEAPWTYRGDPKPLLLSEAIEAGRFDRWASRLRVVSSNVPQGAYPFQATGDPDRWRRENAQRAALGEAMRDVGHHDIVCVSDCDEILKPVAFERYAATDSRHVVQPFLPMDLYTPGWRWPSTLGVIARLFRGHLLREGWTCETIRQRQPDEQWMVSNWPYAVASVEEYDLATWGWHLAYMGGPEAIRYKVAQAAHPELEPLLLDDLEPCYTQGLDLFGRSHRFCIRVPDTQLPESCQDFEWYGRDLLPAIDERPPLTLGGTTYVETP